MSESASDVKKGSFHWQAGWYFRRLDNGTVQVAHLLRDTDGEERVDQRLLIPADEWASIILAVSARTPTGENYDAARKFHCVP